MAMFYRTAVSAGRGNDFVLSDGTLDRHGTRINPAGWQLDAFRSNPIALFGHSSEFPIGTWKDVRIEGDALRGRLELAKSGTSARIDELRSLFEQGILRGVSVGFRVTKEGKQRGSDGYDYEAQELVEASLVAVPSNPNTLAQARALNVSRETLSLVFGEQAEMRRDILAGEQAEIPPAKRAGKMNPQLAPRIELAKGRVTALQDELTARLASMADEPDDDTTHAIEDLNGKISGAQRALVTLQDAEARLGASAEPIVIDQQRKPPAVAEQRRPWAMPAKKLTAADYWYRAATVGVIARITQAPIHEVRKNYYPADDWETRESTQALVTRAATGPATTTTTGWAAELVTTAFNEFLMEQLLPQSIYPRLSGMGERYSFGRAGKISIPSRSATPSIAGSFVLEGAPIPVRQAAFTSVVLTPKKMAVISLMTREIMEHSTPAIEGLIRRAINEDTATAIDTVLIDNTAATTTRPAGLRAGITGLTPTAGGGMAALVGDIKQMVGVLTAANALRRPVWIMHPSQALSISLVQNAGGEFAFASDINAGTLAGYPVIMSTTVTPTMVILLDAADFASVTGDDPRFDVSDQATVHQEDTTPLPIATGAQGSGVLATPTRSLWQTDSIGIRMILPMNWSLLRTGTLSWVTGVTW